MNKTRSIVALVTALGSAGLYTDNNANPIDPELREARLRASSELRLARSELAQQHPQRALVAIAHAWHELAHVPGGEAFQDLVALEEAARLARVSSLQPDAISAASAVDAALARLQG